MRYLLILIAIIVPGYLFAQEYKIEAEEKISSNEVPELAKLWLATSFWETKKLKWYFERSSSEIDDSLTDESYEAKFIFKHDYYSVEFSSKGIVQDVEILRKWHDIPKETRKILHDSLHTIQKFKLQKLQEQWSSSDPELLKRAIRSEDLSQITIRYEVEFRGKIEGDHAFWEALLDANGRLLRCRKIVMNPTDNLDL